MRQFLATITIILVFVLTPLVADYSGEPIWCWLIGMVVIAYQTWVLLFKKTAKEHAEEQARLAEARRRVEQIKQEAAMVYLQPTGGKKGGAAPTLDVDKMSPVELANAARQIVHDIRGKKGPKGESGTEASMPNAA
jgi:hypothetical protein